MPKDKSWPWACVCRGGAKKDQPAIKTVYPHIVKNVKICEKNTINPRYVIVPEIRCGRCVRCGNIWYSKTSEEDISAFKRRVVVIQC